MIHICYGIHDRDGRYSKFIGTSIVSIFENTQSQVTVHILHDNTFNSDNRDRFNYIAGRYGQQVKFYDVELLAADDIIEIKRLLPVALQSRYTIGAFYRLIMQNIIKSIDKIIYLDGDTIVNLDISELWNFNLQNCPIAAVNESNMDFNFSNSKLTKYMINCGKVKEEDYFNSGVLLIDLEHIRNDDQLLKSGYKFIIEHPECSTFDQDILNYCFSDNYIKLPPRFNMFTLTQRVMHKPCTVKKMIYHYAGGTLGLEIDDVFNQLFFKYFTKTPWFNFDIISRLSEIIRKSHNDRQNLLLKMTNSLIRKRRVFVAYRSNFEVLKRIFEIQPGEEMIDSNTFSVTLDSFIKTITKSHNDKIYFILINNYEYIRDILIKNDLIEGKDFIDVTMLLSEQQGIPFNSHFIIQAM